MATPAVILSEPLRQSLLVMAQASPAQEVCALLGGTGNEITSIYPVDNVADDPANRFLLDAEGQIAAMKMMREAHESMRGIFHSHPFTAAEPSAIDASLASYPDVYYLILSLAADAPELRAFYYDGRDFHAIGINE